MALPFATKRKWTVHQDGSTTTDSGATAPSITAGQTDFPVLLYIDSNSWNAIADTEVNGYLDDFFDGTNNPGGKRVKFYPTEADLIADTNALDYEVAPESFDTTAETCEIHVQRTTGASSTEIWMGMGEGATGWATTDQDNATGSWDANHKGVWHLGEDVTDEQSSGTHIDSTGTQDITQGGNVEGPAQIGDGQVFDGVDDLALATVAGWQSADTTGTLSAWVKRANIAATDTWFGSGDEASASRYMQFYMSSTGQFGVYTDKNAPDNGVVTTQANFDDDTLHHVVYVSTGTAWIIYVDGSSEALSLVAGSNNGDWFGDVPDRDNITLGGLKRNTIGGNGPFTIDECRYSNAVRSADYVKSEYFSAKKTNYPGDNWMVVSDAEPVAADAFPVPFVWWEQ